MDHSGGTRKMLGRTLAALVLVFTGAGRSTGGAELERALPVLDDKARLSDYLEYAELNNAGLQAAFGRWKAALEQVPQAKALPDPRFSYTYFVQEVETRVGPQRQKFGIAQMFPWFGTLRLKGDAASEAAAAAQQDYEKERLVLRRRVTAAYHELWFLAQAIAITREHIKLVGNIEGVARARFRSGSTPNSAVVQLQVELGRLEDRLRTMEALRAPIVADLNAALNPPALLALPWPHGIPEIDASFTDAQAREWLAESNPDLRRLDRLIGKEEASIKLARRSAYPDFTFGVDYVQTDDALMPGTPDSGKDPVMAMVSVNLPIWRGKYRAAERQARLQKAAVEDARQDAGRRLEADLAMALYHFRDAGRKISLYNDALIPKVQQSLEVANQGFQAGNTTFIALIDAQRLLLEFQLERSRAEADRGKRAAEIEMLTGRQLIKAQASRRGAAPGGPAASPATPPAGPRKAGDQGRERDEDP